MSASKFSRYIGAFRSISVISAVALLPSIAHATPMNAGTIMEKMELKERYAFLAGIIEGLAMSRYMQDGKKPDGMKCIYDWLYEHDEHVDTVYEAFRRYPEYPPGTVVDLLVRKACPA